MADEKLTIKALKEMAATMLRIYPGLTQKIAHFETLVVQHFRDADVAALKALIIDALEAMRQADEREMRHLAMLQDNPRLRQRLRTILSTIQLQLARLQVLERDIAAYERRPSPELTAAINRLIDELGGLLRREDEQLRDLDAAA